MQVLTFEQLESLVQALRDRGTTVIGPTRRDHTIVHDELTSVAELPAGLADEQDGGQYRLVDTGTSEVFAFSTPSESWKRFLYPERTLLIRARRANGEVHVTEPEPGADDVAFFGIRSCDLAALDRLDAVFIDPAATDPTYASRRTATFIVAAACNRPGGTCFCASMNTGPTPSAGYDLMIRELTEPEHRFIVEAGTERGADLLASLDSRPADAQERTRAADAHASAVDAMGRSLDPEAPGAAAATPEHARWTDVAERCLACANCTMICPTCFCSRTEDSNDLTGEVTERWRSWDSCFTTDFTHLHGGAVRQSTRARYRQWLLHKLVTWHDQFDMSGCVGCGRCITWCPVGIDITQEVAAFASDTPQTAPEGGNS